MPDIFPGLKAKDMEITDGGSSQTQEIVMVVSDQGVKKGSAGRQKVI